MSTLTLTSALVPPLIADTPPARTDELQELQERLRAAEERLAAVEAVRLQQAETASFLSAVEDHVRAAVFWTCEAQLRASLRR